jgi:DNA (cytosine-5)-methyltransferase 1
MVTFMDIVAYLKPKYVLMENVVDILKFADGYLGRYALSCLVAMNYQARLGIVVAGCYGLPQFRMRVFLWGCLPSMVCLLTCLFICLLESLLSNQLCLALYMLLKYT